MRAADLFCIALLGGMVTTPGPAAARELKVPEEHATVAAAVEAAEAGDVIVIGEGEHVVKKVKLKGGLTLKGAGRAKTALLVPTEWEGLWVENVRGVSLQDLSIRPSGSAAEKDWALVAVLNRGELTAERLELIGGRAGLLVLGESVLALRDCRVTGQREAPLRVADGSTARAERSDFSSSRERSGVSVNNANVELINSIVYRNKQGGVDARGGASVEIYYSVLADNGLHGLSATEEGTRASVEHSVVFRNRGNGIWSYNGGVTHVADTVVASNGRSGVISTSPDGTETTGALHLDHNLVWDNRRSPWRDGTLPADHIKADPGFVAPESFIFALAPDSPARGKGRGGKDIGLYPEGRLLTALVLPTVDMPKTPSAVRKPTAPTPPPGRRLALVVGIEQYRDDGIPDLRFARDDADDVAAFLKTKNYRVEKLTDGDATLAKVREELTQLTKARPQDTVVVFFSGHGSDEADPLGRGRGFLLPVGARAESLPATGLPLSELAAASDSSEAERFAIFLDACFSGGQKSVSGRRAGLKSLDDSSLTGGLSFGPGKISLFSSRDNEPSFEAAEHRNGYFTYYLLQAWERGLQSADEVYAHLFEGVTRDTDGRQHPRRDYDRTEGVAATY